MGEGHQLPVRDLEQTGPLPPVLLQALSTRNAAHTHLDWTLRTRADSTELVLRWEIPRTTKAPATKKRIGLADIPARPTYVPRATSKKRKVADTPATTRHVEKQQPTALFRATVQSGKCKRRLPACTTAEVTTAKAAAAAPTKRKKTPCRARHDQLRWRAWKARTAEKRQQRELPAVRPTLAVPAVPEADTPATAETETPATDNLPTPTEIPTAEKGRQRELPAVPPTLATVPEAEPPATETSPPVSDQPEEPQPPPPTRRCTLYKYTKEYPERDSRRLFYGLHFEGSRITSIRDSHLQLSTGKVLKSSSYLTTDVKVGEANGIISPPYLASLYPHPRDEKYARHLWKAVAKSEHSHVLADYEL